MAVSGKYGIIDISGIPSDEPVFVLRAQDALARAALEMYRSLVSTHNPDMVPSIEKEVGVFRDWDGERKIPD